MQAMIRTANRWLLPAVLILFILQAGTLAFALSSTYSGRSESPDHVLTYTPGRLTWDDATGIDENGVAMLDLFDAEYKAVKSEDGKNVVAPGTDGFNVVRLKNQASGAVTYTAVLYRIKSDEDIPVEAVLDGAGFEDTTEYMLPEGVLPEHVIRAVEGVVRGKQIQDFDINWLWDFYKDMNQDEIDTMLGDRSALLEDETVLVGLYIVVVDRNDYTDRSDIPAKKPTEDAKEKGEDSELGVLGEYEEELEEGYSLTVLPMTGDDGKVMQYLITLIVSGLALIIMFILRWREEENEKKA